MFIIGNPEDTKDTVIQSIEYSKYLPSLYSQFSVLHHPGRQYIMILRILLQRQNKIYQYNLTFELKI